MAYKNREERLAKQRARYYANREENLAKRKAYETSHRADRLEYYRAYYATNKDRISAQNKASDERRKAADPEAYRRARRNIELRHDYGITLVEYERMLAEQGDGCKICGSKDPRAARGLRIFAVDHCHATGKVRGLLCFNCNAGIGAFKDDPALLAKAIDYLAKARAI